MLNSRPLTHASLAWSNLGLQWLQMLSASGQAIAHRTSRANTPAQLFDMSSEKVLAAIESSSAMTRQLMTFPASSPIAMWNAWARVLSSGVTPYRVRATRNARAGRKRR